MAGPYSIDMGTGDACRIGGWASPRRLAVADCAPMHRGSPRDSVEAGPVATARPRRGEKVRYAATLYAPGQRAVPRSLIRTRARNNFPVPGVLGVASAVSQVPSHGLETGRGGSYRYRGHDQALSPEGWCRPPGRPAVLTRLLRAACP